MKLQSEEGSTGLPEAGDAIDTATFEQILEMDDDEDEREFSKSIVFDFFLQAESTFDKMESNLYARSLKTPPDARLTRAARPRISPSCPSSATSSRAPRPRSA